MKIIEHINYPHVYTKCGERIDIKDLKGVVANGSMIDEWNNVVSGTDSDCVNGVCPIK